MEALPAASGPLAGQTIKQTTQHTEDTKEKSMIQKKAAQTLADEPDEVEKGEGLASLTFRKQEPLPSGALLIVGICMTTSNVVVGYSIILTAILLDLLAKDLKLAESDYQWTFNSYLLPLGCLSLVSGRASDIAGGKAVFIVGTMWQGLWTLITAFMKNDIGFFVCRALAGIGAALTMASNVAYRVVQGVS
ncbi:hypothetical protein QFC22_004309 [Naganishia vaughanmartiniae]|uniref:Uncharacterized protein n=1 Tax=Naganishia vaughanmartiniae TaxID=1424756 RepID=A0ACC2X095_9TREE|nr:hypothetical protein QFC22_004309 [Naganishia vaughanmartiniae]